MLFKPFFFLLFLCNLKIYIIVHQVEFSYSVIQKISEISYIQTQLRNESHTNLMSMQTILLAAVGNRQHLAAQLMSQTFPLTVYSQGAGVHSGSR